jgi:hypothetical protein
VDARAALAAWGRFAVSGDLAGMADHFDPDGPQYTQLAEEAPRLAATPLGPPYAMTLTDPLVMVADDEIAEVEGLIVMTRPGEPNRTFPWRLHLRRGPQGWRVWTVEPLTD